MEASPREDDLRKHRTHYQARDVVSQAPNPYKHTSGPHGFQQTVTLDDLRKEMGMVQANVRKMENEVDPNLLGPNWKELQMSDVSEYIKARNLLKDVSFILFHHF